MTTHPLRLAAAAAAGLLAASGLWLVWPEPPPPLDDLPERQPVQQVKLQKAPKPRPVVGRTVPEGPPKLDVGPEHASRLQVRQPIGAFDPEGDLIGQIDALVARPFEPPPQLDDPQVAANRAYWRRNEELKKMETRLLKRIEQNVSPYETFEARVALAQVYRSQAQVMGMGRAPDGWTESRASKWQGQIDEFVATTEDKAAMLVQMLESEAATWPADDPAVRRLAEMR